MLIQFKTDKAQVTFKVDSESFSFDLLESVVRGAPFGPADKEFPPIAIEPECPQDSVHLATALLTALREKNPPHYLLKEWLEGALNKIIESDGADKNAVLTHLGLKRKGRGRPSDEKKHYDIAADVAALMKSGMTLEAASFELADKYGIHEANIVKAYARFKDVVLHPNDPIPF